MKGNIVKTKLLRYWSKATKKDLIHLFLNGIRKSIRDTALKKLKKRKDLALDDVYELMISSEHSEDIWEMFILLGATPEDFMEVIRCYDHFAEKAKEELEARMKEGSIAKNRSKRILKDIFESVPSKREWAWRLLKPLNPSNDDLKRFLDQPFIGSLLTIQSEIEKIIRKQSKRVNHGDRLTHKIEALVEKLTNKEQ